MPVLAACALQSMLLSLLAGGVPLDHPLPAGSTDDLMQYDDGSAFWLWWEGTYRGVWFHSPDFFAGSYTAISVEFLELWFYHHSYYPWDTGSFYAELYNGGSAGPATLVSQTSVTAVHYSPCFAQYPFHETVEPDFWGMANTTMSSGGWPSILGDNTPMPVSHSYYSDDFAVWQPWIVQGATSNNFFIRVDGTPTGVSLDRTTWGAVKALY